MLARYLVGVNGRIAYAQAARLTPTDGRGTIPSHPLINHPASGDSLLAQALDRFFWLSSPEICVRSPKLTPKLKDIGKF